MVTAVLKDLGGHGPPLLLIHGFGSDSKSWSAIVAGLSDHHKLLAVDLPGHGDAQNEVGDGHPASLASAVRACLSDIDGPVHVLAHSLGGAVAAELHRLEPAKFLSLVLLAPVGMGFGVDKGFLKDFPQVADEAELRALLLRLVAREALIKPPLLGHVKASLEQRGRREALRRIASHLTIPDLPSLHLGSSAHVIWGEDDRINPFDPNLHTAYPGRVHLLPRCGHLPHVEAAAKVSRIVREANEQSAA